MGFDSVLEIDGTGFAFQEAHLLSYNAPRAHRHSLPTTPEARTKTHQLIQQTFIAAVEVVAGILLHNRSRVDHDEVTGLEIALGILLVAFNE